MIESLFFGSYVGISMAMGILIDLELDIYTAGIFVYFAGLIIL